MKYVTRSLVVVPAVGLALALSSSSAQALTGVTCSDGYMSVYQDGQLVDVLPPGTIWVHGNAETTCQGNRVHTVFYAQ